MTSEGEGSLRKLLFCLQPLMRIDNEDCFEQYNQKSTKKIGKIGPCRYLKQQGVFEHPAYHSLLWLHYHFHQLLIWQSRVMSLSQECRPISDR